MHGGESEPEEENTSERDTVESEESDGEESDEDQPTIRPRSTRIKRPARSLTYDEPGGDPVMRAVASHPSCVAEEKM